MVLEVIGKAVISGHCERCGCGGVLRQVRDEAGRRMILCGSCLEKARQKGSF